MQNNNNNNNHEGFLKPIYLETFKMAIKYEIFYKCRMASGGKPLN